MLDIKLSFGINKVTVLALGKTHKDSYRPKLHHLCKYLKGQCALLFTLGEQLVAFRLAEYCRPGAPAEQTLLLPNVISNAIRATKSTGGGRFLTEFGLCGDDGNPRSVNTIECNNILNEADKHFESWTYWDSNLLDLSGNPIVKSFIRPYPHSIRGVFRKQQFDHKTGDFHLSFIANTTKEQNNQKQTLIAEIYIPRSVHYPNGFSMSVKPDNLSTKMNENMMYVYLPSGVSNASVFVRIEIVRNRSSELF
ncbi:Glycoside hydrolase subgroup catalytic core [Schistosoma japonicum]|nr:Glycoside hydrolase subgroup catalytic core [Schistosoma japonicum]